MVIVDRVGKQGGLVVHGGEGGSEPLDGGEMEKLGMDYKFYTIRWEKEDGLINPSNKEIISLTVLDWGEVIVISKIWGGFCLCQKQTS